MTELEADPYHLYHFGLINFSFNTVFLSGIAVFLIFLILSAFVSGGEAALFSLGDKNTEKLRESTRKRDRVILQLIEYPQNIAATALIVKNFFNVGVVVSGVFLLSHIWPLVPIRILYFVLHLFIITIIILFFGEILPKLLATKNPYYYAALTAPALSLLNRICKPLRRQFTSSSSVLNKIMHTRMDFSMDELSQAMDITASSNNSEEKRMLRGIVKFGNTDVKEIIKSRIDVTAVEFNTSFPELFDILIESGYSRIPVYEENFDQVKGVLYIKDLLPYLKNSKDFRWQSLLRAPYFVSETKKINDILEEFQTKNVHLAIVMDEYGGSTGIVTLEDIIEEIVGEIKDESDIEEFMYYKINEKNYIFEGKVSLNDFHKITETDDTLFDEVKGDAETLAGLILELKGELPLENEKISYNQFDFIIKSVDERRIRRIRVKINES